MGSRRVLPHGIECIVTSLYTFGWRNSDWKGLQQFLDTIKLEEKNLDLLSRIFDCFNSFEPSIPTQLKSPNGNQSTDENESKEESDSEEEADIKKQPTRRFEHPKVNVSIDLPSYDGRKGKARVFIDKFLALCKANHFDKDQWDSLLSACFKKDALKFFNMYNKRKLYPKWNDFFNKFTNFFDNKSSDNEFYWFHKIFQQNDGQDFGPWFLIFEEKVQQMQAINQYPAYDEPTFHQTYMRDLYCKLNKSCFTIVDKRLKEYGKEAKDVTEEHFKSWIDEATSETKNACAFSKSNQPPRQHGKAIHNSSQHKNSNFSHQKDNSATPKFISNHNSNTPNSSTKKPFCYYCGNYDHWMKQRIRKVGHAQIF